MRQEAGGVCKSRPFVMVHGGGLNRAETYSHFKLKANLAARVLGKAAAHV